MVKEKIGFIGGGAMAEALIGGLIRAGIATPSQIVVNDISQERLNYLKATFSVVVISDIQELARQSDILFLTVKPHIVNDVLNSINHSVAKSTIVISIAAGISIAQIQDKLPEVPVVRVMPNTPVAVGEGMSAIALGKYAGNDIGNLVSTFFAAVGKAVIVSEESMDAVTGLSGSGPGYAFVLIDALADAGVRVGLSRQTSILLAAQTLMGAAKMVLETGEHPAKLRDMVTSPGGTTIAGIHMLEQKAVRATLIDAVLAATNKSRELGKRND